MAIVFLSILYYYYLKSST